MREVRLEFDQVSKRNTELEEQVEKYKTAVEAQKKYIIVESKQNHELLSAR